MRGAPPDEDPRRGVVLWSATAGRSRAGDVVTDHADRRPPLRPSTPHARSTSRRDLHNGARSRTPDEAARPRRSRKPGSSGRLAGCPRESSTRSFAPQAPRTRSPRATGRLPGRNRGTSTSGRRSRCRAPDLHADDADQRVSSGRCTAGPPRSPAARRRAGPRGVARRNRQRDRTSRARANDSQGPTVPCPGRTGAASPHRLISADATGFEVLRGWSHHLLNGMLTADSGHSSVPPETCMSGLGRSGR